VEHGVSAIPALGIAGAVVRPGFDYTVRVSPTADQVGRFNFACTRVCGAGHGGMHGAIEVQAPPPEAPLELRGGRFSATATFRTPGGTLGDAHAVALTDDSGYFWFFDARNVEILLKVLDGCGTNGRYWVFAAGLTDVEVEFEVTDTATGARRAYSNPRGSPFVPVQDTAAFHSCP
jgi:hypothetical protein